MATRIPTLKIDPKSVQALQAAAEKPFYATVGVTDLAVEAVRELAADVQARVSGYSKDVQKNVDGVRKNVASIDLQPRALRESAVSVVTELSSELSGRVDALQGEARKAPARVQTLVDGNVALLEGAYGDLVKRGESLVGRVRRQKSTQDTVAAAETTVAKAKTTRTQATKAAKSTTNTAKSTAKKATTTAKKRSAAPRSSAKATATAAKKTAATATKAVADAAQKVGD